MGIPHGALLEAIIRHEDADLPIGRRDSRHLIAELRDSLCGALCTGDKNRRRNTQYRSKWKLEIISPDRKYKPINYHHLTIYVLISDF